LRPSLGSSCSVVSSRRPVPSAPTIQIPVAL
jgi:hypothetical protein